MSRLYFALGMLSFGGLCGIASLSLTQHHDAQPTRRTLPRLTRILDTLPTGTIVVCYTHDQALACVLDPAMEGATP